MAREKGTGLTDDQADHLAKVLAAFLPQFGNKQTVMARAWGISQPQLSQILMGAAGKGAGVAVLCRLRTHTQMSIDDLLGLPPLARDRAAFDDRIRASVEKALDDLGARPASRPLLPPKPSKER